MIDVHHHCLPGVDDGPRDWAEAVDLCAMAAEEGIDTIVATPHVMRGRWQNTSREKLQALASELRARTGNTPHLLLGSEYYFAHDIADVVQAGKVLPLAGSRYVLVEFASNAIPPLVEQPLYRMQLEGWTPIIAHPERNQIFQSKPELLVSLIALGAKTQVTCGSFTGAFGPEAQRAAEAWLERGMVHMIATDAHNPKRRPPLARAAIERVTELAGAAVADALAVQNPAAVISARPLDYEPEPAPPRKGGGFLDRLRGLWGHRA